MNATATITDASINLDTHEAFQRVSGLPCTVKAVVDYAIADLHALGASAGWVELPSVIAGLAGRLELRGVDLRFAGSYLGTPRYVARF
jgi:hypothetical protein